MLLIILRFLLVPFASINIIRNSYRRDLVNLGSIPWQIGFLPSLLTHPIFLIFLLLSGYFTLPNNPEFYPTFIIGTSLYLNPSQMKFAEGERHLGVSQVTP